MELVEILAVQALEYSVTLAHRDVHARRLSSLRRRLVTAERAQRRYGFELTRIDVDTVAELTGCYGQEVPVIEVNGKVRFRGVVSAVLLQRLFDSRSESES